MKGSFKDFRFRQVVLIAIMALGIFSKTNAKFINTFLCRIGGSSMKASDSTNLARYDAIICNRFHYNDINGDTWATLKTINPGIQIYLYTQFHNVRDTHDDNPIQGLNGIGRYDSSRGHSMGSLNGDNTDLFLIDTLGNRITSSYPSPGNNYYLDFGNPKLQQYSSEVVIHDIVNQPWKADGVFSDHCFSRIAGYSGPPPDKYRTDEEFGAAMITMLDHMSSRMHPVGQKVNSNRGGTIFDNGSQNWRDLDKVDNPPDASIEEGAFAVKWGNSSDVQFYPEARWKNQVDLMGDIHNYQVWYLCHSDITRGETGTDNYGKQAGFWDVFWYCRGSYLLAKNDVDNNSYFGYSEGYSNPTWFDELDHIDLGQAIGEYQTTVINKRNIYWREYKLGFVYVNPSTGDVTGIKLPETCKQINHSNFKDDLVQLTDIDTLDLVSHRAAIVYKSKKVVPPKSPNNLKIVVQ